MYFLLYLLIFHIHLLKVQVKEFPLFGQFPYSMIFIPGFRDNSIKKESKSLPLPKTMHEIKNKNLDVIDLQIMEESLCEGNVFLKVVKCFTKKLHL